MGGGGKFKSNLPSGIGSNSRAGKHTLRYATRSKIQSTIRFDSFFNLANPPPPPSPSCSGDLSLSLFLSGLTLVRVDTRRERSMLALRRSLASAAREKSRFLSSTARPSSLVASQYATSSALSQYSKRLFASTPRKAQPMEQSASQTVEASQSSSNEVLSLEVPTVSLYQNEGRIGVTWSSGIESK